MEGLELSAIAASLVTFGAAYGISKIGKAAMEAIARQPEAAQSIRTGMIIAAALIEGIAFFCGVICIIR